MTHGRLDSVKPSLPEAADFLDGFCGTDIQVGTKLTRTDSLPFLHAAIVGSPRWPTLIAFSGHH